MLIPAKSAIIDCELVACDEAGLPCFRTLMDHSKNNAPLCLWAFDLLYLNGVRITPLSLTDRKEALAELIMAADTEHMQFSGTFADPIKLLETCNRMGLEGIVSKRKDSAYRSGPTRDWLKIKTVELGARRMGIGGSNFKRGGHKRFDVGLNRNRDFDLLLYKQVRFGLGVSTPRCYEIVDGLPSEARPTHGRLVREDDILGVVCRLKPVAEIGFFPTFAKYSHAVAVVHGGSTRLRATRSGIHKAVIRVFRCGASFTQK